MARILDAPGPAIRHKAGKAERGCDRDIAIGHALPKKGWSRDLSEWHVPGTRENAHLLHSRADAGPAAFRYPLQQVAADLAPRENRPVGWRCPAHYEAVNRVRRVKEGIAPEKEDGGEQRRHARRHPEGEIVPLADRSRLVRARHRADGADQTERGDPVRKEGGAGGRVRTAARDPGHGKPSDSQCVGKLRDIESVAGQSAARMIGRNAEARPFRRDEPDAEFERNGMRQMEHEARARRAVKTEDRHP